MVAYLCVRGMAPVPLFIFTDGRKLTRQRFTDQVFSALHRAGLNRKHYASHTFRIGAATTAAKKGIEDSIIKTLGRWESAAYLQYVKISRDQLAGFTKVLGSE